MHTRQKVSSGRDHIAKSVTAGVYLFEWEVLNAFPEIFLCMLKWECVYVRVCLWLEVKTCIFGIRADRGVFKSDIFCAFLFFYTEKKLFEKFLKKRERLKKKSAWYECRTKASLGRMSLHCREHNGLCGKAWEEKERQTTWKRNERTDLLGHFPLLPVTGLNSF